MFHWGMDYGKLDIYILWLSSRHQKHFYHFTMLIICSQHFSNLLVQCHPQDPPLSAVQNTIGSARRGLTPDKFTAGLESDLLNVKGECRRFDGVVGKAFAEGDAVDLTRAGDGPCLIVLATFDTADSM